MNPMQTPKTHLELVVREGRAVRILVVECEGRELPQTDDRPSSIRLRKAEPVATEFDDLRRWRESAVRARKVGSSGGGTMFALALLLADGNGRGGGDARTDSPRIGSWAGDRIVISGDYADHGKFGAPEDQTLFTFASETFTDISGDLVELVARES
jgi:hypothetical protein